MTDFQPSQPPQSGPPLAGAFEPPKPPAAPTRRTRDRKVGRFAAGIALGALVGASVAGGIVAVADNGNSAAPAAASAPAHVTPVADAHNSIAALVQKVEPSVVSIHDDVTTQDGPLGQ